MKLSRYAILKQYVNDCYQDYNDSSDIEMEEMMDICEDEDELVRLIKFLVLV